jgi:Fe-S-cluster-containing hydrogenase component 2
MRESTKALMAKHGWRIDRAIHNYLYFSFYYPYVRSLYQLFAFLAKYLSWFKPLNLIIKTSFARYHSKVISGENITKILELNENISAVDEKNKKIVPFAYAYKILFQEPDFIAVMDCPCKKALKAPDWTINSCISVGKKTSQFWLDRCGKKYNARKISQKEAIDLIKKFREKGYLTQAFFKVATGGSTGVICNCHIDNCVSLQASRFAQRFDPGLTMNADSGYSMQHDNGKCRHCGTCARICQFEAIGLNGDKRTYKRELCMGCGLCMEHCPGQALRIYQDPQKTVPLDMDIVKKEYIPVQSRV